MIEPKKWNSWNDIILKLGSLGVSMKYQIAVFASFSLVVGLLTATEWIIFMGALLGIREVGNVLNRRTDASNEIGETNGEQPS